MDVAERIGYRIIRRAETESTNDDAKREASAGAPGGLVVVASHQTAGRGRQGRVWISPPGLGLYASIVIRPGWPAGDAAWLGVLAGLAVLDAVRELGAASARLKWPNDVLVGARKIAGVLVEPRIEAGRIDFAVIGIGLNLRHRRADWPAHLADLAVSLQQLGGCTDPETALGALCRCMQARYDRARAAGAASLLQAWEASCGLPDLPEIGEPA